MMSASTNNIMNTPTNPTAAQIAQYTATVTQVGKKWVHTLIDENGQVIAKRSTDNCTPYRAACVTVVTLNSRIHSLKREIVKSRSKSFIESCKHDIQEAQADIAAGVDGNQYFGFIVSWTRGLSGSASYGSIIARLVPCKA